MRTRLIPLISLGFLASAGVSAAWAQDRSTAADRPIATAPPEVARSAARTARPPRAAVVRALDMTETRREAIKETMTAAEAPAAAALSPGEEIDPRRERDRMVELSPTTSFGIRRVDASEPLGGFLRSNPHLNRANRKQVGLSLKF